MKQNCSVKDMLAGGMSAEELLKSLHEEIEKAQAEIDAENKVKESTLAMTRETLAAALLDYLIALDIMPAEVLAEAKVEDLVEVIKMKQDWYMDTEEALEWGVIDEIMYVPNKKNKRK